jgi:hypothetical protein
VENRLGETPPARARQRSLLLAPRTGVRSAARENNTNSYDRAHMLRATRLDVRAGLFSSAETVWERPRPRERGNDRCCSPRAQVCAAWHARTTQTLTTARTRSVASRASKRARRRRPNRAARVCVALRGWRAWAGGGIVSSASRERDKFGFCARARLFRRKSQAQKRARDQQHHHHHQRRCRRTRRRRRHHHASHTRPGPHHFAEYDQRAPRCPYYGASRN